jgi:hypothetical protein
MKKQQKAKDYLKTIIERSQTEHLTEVNLDDYFIDFEFNSYDLRNGVILTIGVHTKYNIKVSIGTIENIYTLDIDYCSEKPLPKGVKNEVLKSIESIEDLYSSYNYIYSEHLIKYFSRLVDEEYKNRNSFRIHLEDDLDEYFNRDVA